MWSIAADVLVVSLPSMGERLIMSMALLTYFKLLSGYGTAAVAAYAIGVRLLSLSWVPGIAFGAAASAFVGQALGAGDSVRARQVGVRSLAQARSSWALWASRFSSFAIRLPPRSPETRGSPRASRRS